MSETSLNLTSALKAHREQNADECLREVSPILKNVPHHPVALHLKAWAISTKGESDRAIKILSEVVENNPKLVPVRAEYGKLLMANRRHAEALKPLKEAYEMQPERDEVAIKYCTCLIKNHQYREAETMLREILDRSSHHFQARFILATALLQKGDWQEGFDHYQIRSWLHDCEDDTQRLPFDFIEWKGEDIQGKRILIQCEQSYSDQVMFIRYANWLKETHQPKSILVHANQEMRALLETVEAVDEVVTDLSNIQVDRYVSLLNLPFYHKTTPDTIPEATEPYLFVPEEKTEKWNQKLTDEQPKIALCWSTKAIGNEPEAIDKEVKSLDRRHAEHLCQQLRSMFSDAEIISLQPAKNKKERSMFKRNNVIDISDQSINDYADTAAILDRMDLVVTIDTTVAHIAGALGKPVWNLLPFYADWRYTQDEEYSNWYPNMRLFRQENEDDMMSLDSPKLLAELTESVE